MQAAQGNAKLKWVNNLLNIPGLFSSGFVRTLQFANLHELLRTLKKGIHELYEKIDFWGKNAPKSAPFMPKTAQSILIIHTQYMESFCTN
jgi:hypothetical protein